MEKILYSFETPNSVRQLVFDGAKYSVIYTSKEDGYKFPMACGNSIDILTRFYYKEIEKYIEDMKNILMDDNY